MSYWLTSSRQSVPAGVGFAEGTQALVRIAGSREGPADGEGRILAEDRQLEGLELGGRVDAQLVGENAPSLPVHAQRIGLAAGAVEGAHELSSQVLAQGLLGDEQFELTRDLTAPAKGKVRFKPILERAQPTLAEAGDLRLQEREVGEILERLAVPQLQCGA